MNEMMKKILYISFLAIFSQLIFSPVLVPKAHAADTWLEFFFPSLRKPVEDPTDTLQAPFADMEAQKKKDEIAKGVLPENSVPLEKAHRDYEAIEDWTTSAVSELITYDGAKIQDHLKEYRQYFSSTGWQEYGVFLQEHELVVPLQKGGYNLNSIVETLPRLLNEGVVGGTYRWLYEVPAMLTYVKSGATDYKKFEPVNKRILINLEIGRSNDSANDVGVWIERWSATAVKK